MGSKKRTIRFGHTSDWHLTNSKRSVRRNEDGVSIRLLDAVDNIHKMIRFLKHHEADFLLVCGDIFDSAPDEVTREAFAEILGAILWSGIPTVFTIGQHDLGRKHHFLESFNYVVEEFPLEAGNVTVIDTLSNIRIPLVKGDVNVIVQPWERKIDPRLWRGFMEDDVPNVLMGHFGVIGGLMNDSFRSDRGIPPHAFDPFDYVALGDFHNPAQRYYSGSIYRVTFSERNQKKGFRFVSMAPKGEIEKVEFVDIHDRPFVEVACGVDEVITLSPEAMQGDPIVKLKIKGTSDEIATFARMSEAEIRKQLISTGAADVIVNYETENVDREAKVEGLDANVSIDDALEAYVSSHPPMDGNGKWMRDFLAAGRNIITEVRGSAEESEA